MSHVFISYSHEDSDYVRELREALIDKGFSVWMDEDIEPGARWWSSIVKGIESCGAVIVVMTPEAEKSTWVEKEIQLAYEHGKSIFGLLLRGKVFSILINEQYVELKPTLRYIPELRFYRTLSNYARRIQKEVSDPKHPPAPQVSRKEEKEYSIDINKWIKNIHTSNDYYGITMLALAFEDRDMHERAIYYLRKAHMLEPRIKEKGWMNKLHDWEEFHHILLEKIISDPAFWKNYR